MIERCSLAGEATMPDIEREEVLAEIREASSPHEASTAISDARAWLAEHPDDHRVESAMAELMEFQRESLRSI